MKIKSRKTCFDIMFILCKKKLNICIYFPKASIKNIKGPYTKVPVLDVVPVARLEAFRALKLSRLESFRALNFIGQVRGF